MGELPNISAEHLDKLEPQRTSTHSPRILLLYGSSAIAMNRKGA